MTLVLTPLRVERWALSALAPVRTGAGPARSARAATRLRSHESPGPGDTIAPADPVAPAGDPGDPGGASGAGPAQDRPVLIAGLCGALAPDLEPGDVVVADRILGGPEPVDTADPAPLAAALRARGLRVHVGPVVSVDAPVDGARRAALARAEPSAIAVDTESAWLAAAGDPVAVVRVVVDTPDRPLLRPGTAVRGVRALRVLRRAAPVLGAWSPTAAPTLPEEVN